MTVVAGQSWLDSTWELIDVRWCRAWLPEIHSRIPMQVASICRLSYHIMLFLVFACSSRNLRSNGVMNEWVWSVVIGSHSHSQSRTNWLTDRASWSIDYLAQDLQSLRREADTRKVCLCKFKIKFNVLCILSQLTRVSRTWRRYFSTLPPLTVQRWAWLRWIFDLHTGSLVTRLD